MSTTKTCKNWESLPNAYIVHKSPLKLKKYERMLEIKKKLRNCKKKL